MANATLGNVNQKTPYGSLTYNQTGQKFINDANGGTVYFNPTTGQYSNVRPTTGMQTIAGTPATQGSRPGVTSDSTGYTDNHLSGSAGTPDQQVPIYDQAWQELKGYTVPTYEAVTSLSPEQQAILDQENIAGLNMAKLAAGSSGRLNDLLGQRFDLSGAPAAGTAGQYTNYGPAPSLITSFGDAGSIRDYIDAAGAIQRSFGDAGDITRTYGTDFSEDRKRVEDALMQRQQPGLDAARRAAEAKLANQGIKLGSQAYDAASRNLATSENDARLATILAGGQEQSRLVGLEANRAAFENAAQAQNFGQLLSRGQFANAAQAQQYGQNANDAQFTNSAQAQRFGQLLDRANFGNNATQQNFANTMTVGQANNALQTQRFNEQNAARQQWLNEKYAERSQPINEIASLLSGAQVQNPSFVSTNMPTIPTVDYAGLVQQNYANQMQAYQQKQASIGGLLGGIGSILSLSDKRTKKDIQKVGQLLDKTNVYEFRYKGQSGDEPKSVGVMAQEVEKTHPEAVTKGKDGLRRVNYGLLLAKAA